MSSGKGVAQQQQRVSSLQVPDSAYGQCIPYCFGRCRCAGKLIYWGNFQQGQQSSKKGGKSGGQVIYTVNADMLLGYGPFEGIASTWQNQAWLYVNFSSQTFTGSGTGTSFTFTISNNASTFVMIMGAAYQVSYSESYSDYAGYGATRSFSRAGTSLLPLYNALFPAPNYNNWANSGGPYAEYNATYGADTVTVVFPSPVTNPVVIVYYAENGGSDQPQNNSTGKKGGGGVPVQIPGLTFEPELGSGPSGNPQVFTEFSGVGAANMPLGPSPEIPYLNYECKTLFGLGNASMASVFNPATGGYTAATSSGDCNPADIIVDIVTSGNRNLNSSSEIWNHGLGFSSQQGTSNLAYSYSRFGGILADEFGGGLGLLAVRDYCLAYGIFISGVLDSQRSAAALLEELCKVANCAPVWDGSALAFIPYCEVSAYGNGTSYTAPTAGGPIFNLTDLHFQPLEDLAPVEFTRSRAPQNYNSLQIGFRDATQQYNDNFIIVADSMDIMLQGQMPGPQESYEYITSPLIAQSVGWQRLRRTLTVERQTFRFSLPAYWEVILTPMDLITILEPSISNDPIPVRITAIEISAPGKDGKRSMEVTAEPFIYGGSAPLPAPATGAAQPTSGGGTGNQAPGSVNTPFFIEAIPALNTAGPELWICLSGVSAYYGGTSIWLSLDGGSSYGDAPIGVVTGRQTQGVVYSANYPSHANPDNTNTLHVDLTESLGSLIAVSSAAQNAYDSLWALAGGGTVVVNGKTLTIPYELGAFQGASLLATNKYGLTPPNLRGVYNTPIAAHNIGSQFSYLNDGIVFKMPLTQAMIGVTLYFKFTAFNNTGGAQQPLPSVSPYTFTPTGLVGWSYNVGGGGGTGTTGTIGTGDYFISAFEGDPTLTQPIANQILLTHQIPSSAALTNVTLPSGLTGSEAGCKVAPTGSITITIKQNGTSIGTINIAASATSATFTFASQVVLNPGDILDFVFQGTADATLAGLWWTIAGTRS